MCDKCRKQADRNEAKLNYPGLGNKQTQADGIKGLGELDRIMKKVKVRRRDQESIYRLFMPYTGYAPETQALMIRDMTASEDPDDDKPSLFASHPGSSSQPPSQERPVTSEPTVEGPTPEESAARNVRRVLAPEEWPKTKRKGKATPSQ